MLQKGAALLALALAAVLYLGRLDATPIQTGNEAMYTYPAMRMLETGDYLVPVYEHGPFLEKPPLTWWIIAASYRLFGVSIFAARLPGALAALATVGLIAAWARRRSGPEAALVAALALLYSFKFGAFVREAAADAFLALAVTAAMMALDRAARDEAASDTRLGALSGAALALGFYFKGLIGAVLPIGGVAVGLLLDRKRPVRAVRRSAAATAVFLALLAPWHWAMTERLGVTFWKSFYWDNQFLRGSTFLYTHHHRSPIYYIGVLALAAFPWIVFLPAAFGRRRGSSAPLGWFAFGFLFLSALAMKREVYIMPLLPAVALLVGECIASRPRSWRLAWGSAAGALAVAVVLWLRMLGPLPPLVGRDAAVWLGIGLLLLLAATVFAAFWRDRIAGAVAVAMGCALLFLGILTVEARLSRFDPIPTWGKRAYRECRDCRGYIVQLNFTSLSQYCDFEWRDVASAGSVSLGGRNRPALVILRSSEEASLARLPVPVDILDRRPWIESSWVRLGLEPRRPVLVELTLARVGKNPAGTAISGRAGALPQAPSRLRGAPGPRDSGGRVREGRPS
jgi:4-amino-4-deoxy-L-arabinose transferase-like glycosyltransferase